MPGFSVLIQKGVGRVGAVGLLILGIVKLASGSVSDGATLVGWAFVAWGLDHSIRAGNTIMVASEAEKRIEDPSLPTSSKIPAIQREIDKQEAKKP